LVGPGETLGSPWIPLPVRACLPPLLFVWKLQEEEQYFKTLKEAGKY
jgi:hypothetical protein